jgi:hypothetical protein
MQAQDKHDLPAEVIKVLGITSEQAAKLYVSDTNVYQLNLANYGQKEKKSNDKNEKNDKKSSTKTPQKSTEKWGDVADATLYQVHYRAAEPDATVAQFRGTIVDVTSKRIVCRSFPYTPVIDMKIRKAQSEKTKLYEAREGNVVRIFKYGGEVFYTTHRRLNCSRSWWSNPKVTFKTMFDDACKEKKFNVERLFADKGSDNRIYVFLVIHQENQLTTVTDIKPDLLHLATFESGDKGIKQVDFLFDELKPVELAESDAAVKYAEGTPLISVGKDKIPVKVLPAEYKQQLRLRGNTANLELQWYILLDTKEEKKLKTVVHPRFHAAIDGYQAAMDYQIETEHSGPVAQRGTVVFDLLMKYLRWIKTKSWAQKNKDAKSAEQKQFKEYERKCSKQQLTVFYAMKELYNARKGEMKQWDIDRKNGEFVRWIRAQLKHTKGFDLYTMIRDHKAEEIKRAAERKEKYGDEPQRKPRARIEGDNFDDIIAPTDMSPLTDYADAVKGTLNKENGKDGEEPDNEEDYNRGDAEEQEDE